MNAGGSRPLRILVVSTQEPWPLDNGYRLHGYHVLRELARRAEVTLAVPGAAQYRARLPADVRVETMGPAAERLATPSSADRRVSLVLRLVRRHFGHNSEIEEWIHRAARPARFDIALVNGAVLGQHVAAFGVPVVWNPQDELVLPTIREAECAGWRSWPSAVRHAALYAAFERYVAHRAAATIFVSPQDAAYARRWVDGARLEVVPNGVDWAYFRPSDAAPEPGTVAFIGSLEFPPNVDGVVRFATRVWPRIYADGRRLLVVGRRPVAAVKALTALPGVELAADVPDVRPYTARAAVIVVPIRKGGGLKNKILEACAMRRPVVATPRALAGLSARVGADVLAADNVPAWVARVSRLLEQPAHAQKVAQAGYQWVRQAHRWSAVGDRFFRILAAACCEPDEGWRTAAVRFSAAGTRGDESQGPTIAGDEHAAGRVAALSDTGFAEHSGRLSEELLHR
jgi:glycosyltransferase involved in cell wall biosynthesis